MKKTNRFTSKNATSKQSATKTSGQVRIIGGKWRGRKLPVLAAEGLRPTSDRNKETLFNWLQFKLAGTQCLDAFSGSGSLAMEALSRGAAQVVAWDTNPQAVAQLKKLQSLAEASLIVQQTCALTQLEKPATQEFNLVFLDPPFSYQQLDIVANALTAYGWLSDAALIYVEIGKDKAFNPPASWQLLKQKTSAEVIFSLYQFSRN